MGRRMAHAIGRRKAMPPTVAALRKGLIAAPAGSRGGKGGARARDPAGRARLRPSPDTPPETGCPGFVRCRRVVRSSSHKLPNMPMASFGAAARAYDQHGPRSGAVDRRPGGAGRHMLTPQGLFIHCRRSYGQCETGDDNCHRSPLTGWPEWSIGWPGREVDSESSRTYRLAPRCSRPDRQIRSNFTSVDAKKCDSAV